jgi:3-dehydroquinate dehydratase-2
VWEAELVSGTILLLSGPNLNLLGEREPEIYGTTTLADLVDIATKAAAEHGYQLEHALSNHEGDLVDAIHGARNRCDAIVLNAGAFTHYSFALAEQVQVGAGQQENGAIRRVHAFSLPHPPPRTRRRARVHRGRARSRARADRAGRT